jgi:hypothetical protein
MKADLRISIKDNHRGKNLTIRLVQTPFGPRQYWVRMNGKPWPAKGRPVSLTRLLTALRKSLVKAVEGRRRLRRGAVHSQFRSGYALPPLGMDKETTKT